MDKKQEKLKGKTKGKQGTTEQEEEKDVKYTSLLGEQKRENLENCRSIACFGPFPTQKNKNKETRTSHPPKQHKQKITFLHVGHVGKQPQFW